jgi:hypothetical protein
MSARTAIIAGAVACQLILSAQVEAPREQGYAAPTCKYQDKSYDAGKKVCVNHRVYICTVYPAKWEESTERC